MKKEDFHNHMKGKKKILTALLSVLIIFLIVLILSTAVDVVNKIKEGRYISQNVRMRDSIVVSETGEVYAKPDLAIISFTVINEAKTVTDAMDENSATMNDVIKAVKEQGIEDKDVKTTSFNIYPRYEYSEGTYGKRTLVGYEVIQELQVKIRDLGKIGTIIERATSSGANEISDLQMTIDNQDELKKQAREQAIAKAKVKAEELTSQLGVKLGKLVSFNESFYVPYYDTGIYMKEAVGGGGEVPDIQTGENKISVSIV
ncbi:MAG: SIMPL domain-containing protein, partial [Asgard group archaeon]